MTYDKAILHGMKTIFECSECGKITDWLSVEFTPEDVRNFSGSKLLNIQPKRHEFLGLSIYEGTCQNCMKEFNRYETQILAAERLW